jgi:hypothetical protein
VRVIEAVVQSGPEETRYVRAGQGATVVLLGQQPCDEIARSSTFLALAEKRRVFAAAPPAGVGHGWLRGLIDGLGLERPEVIAERSLAGLLAGFAEAHPDRVSSVSLLEEAGRAD